jgi:GT2 family glycosyltransferase
VTAEAAHDDPLVSVVIPCYRQAHFLPDSIGSVLAQTYRHFEIVVVDDGSPDDTRGVVARYPQVRYVWQRNRGLSAARNTGLSHSSGAYVAFLDADDRLTSVALASGSRELSAHPECAFVVGELCVIDEQGAIVCTRPPESVSSDHYLELLKNCFIWCPASVLYRRSVFQAVGGFDTSLNPVSDYDMYLRIARAFPIRTYDEMVAEYRYHDSGMSRNPARMLKFTMKVLLAERRRVKGTPARDAACLTGINFCQAFYGTPLIREISDHLKLRHWKEVIPQVLVALQYHPHAFVKHAYRRMYRTIVEALT